MPKKAKTSKAKRAKGGKKEKDTNAPKRAMSAFFCYQKARRETVLKENPGINNKQLVSVPHFCFEGATKNVRGSKPIL